MDYLLNFDYFLLLRLVAAVILGGLIGWERDEHHHAGLRTHIILCLGAALVMIISENLAAAHGGDITRMGAQVISGIGFLGVGSIIVNGNKVRGITTAAGLWTTACVGLAVGSGHFLLATIVVVLMLFAMLGLRKIRVMSKRYNVKIDIAKSETLTEALKTFAERGARVDSVQINQDGGESFAVLEVKLPKNCDATELVAELSKSGGVREFEAI